MSVTTGAQPQSSSHPSPKEIEKEEATAFLRSLLDKNLRITTTDNRMFWGAFKCTDAESNIVLQHTYEYRQPTLQQISASAAAAAAASSSSPLPISLSSPSATATGSSSAGGEPAADGGTAAETPTATTGPGSGRVRVDMTSRYLGLVVVPGKHIVRIEAEEFASQMRRGKGVLGLGVGGGRVQSGEGRGDGMAGGGGHDGLGAGADVM